MPEGPHLSGKRLRAFKMLAEGAEVVDVAAKLGVTDRSVRRWRAEPTFRDALAAAGQDALQVARDVLEGAAGEAVEVLLALMHDAPPAVRRQAACDVLDRIGLVAGKRVELDGTAEDTAIELDDGTIVIAGRRYRREP